MSKSWLNRTTNARRLARNERKPRRRPVEAPVEPLEGRVMLAVTASLAAGTLFVTGDEQDNVITISRMAGGTILVNGGAIPIVGAPATVANTNHFHLVGGDGNDRITLDEANGALPGAALFGGAGNDTLTGGSAFDFADGGAGSDTVFLGGGDDDFQWNPGDASDMVDGQGGRDTMTFNGADVAERFELSAVGGRARLSRDVGGIVMDLGGVEEIDLNVFGGADTLTVNDQSATGLNTFNVDLNGAGSVFGDNQADAVIINGTDGNDVGQIRSIGTRINATVSAIPFVNITGEDGLDALTVNTLGGDDLLDATDLAATNASQLVKLTLNGGVGNDTLTGSLGFDTFVWNPDDGNDVIDGGDGEDTIVFNGSDEAERFDLSANGNRVRFTRDVGGVTTDFGGVEEIELNALGGADTVTIKDLTGTPVTEVHLNLAGTVGGATADGEADSVVVNGRSQADLIPVIGHNGIIAVDGGFADGSGLPYFILLRAVEVADKLKVNGNGGDDRMDASELETPVTFSADGGAGNDTITGSRDNDAITGGPGEDRVLLGAGDDSFVWNTSDGNDVVEGQAGTDTFNLNGANAAEDITLSANGPRARLTDDLGGVALDFDGIEQVAIAPLGGADHVTVNDLAGTAITHVKVKLNADGHPDATMINGTNNPDPITIDGDLANGVTVSGLAAQIEVVGALSPADTLTVNALGGADTIDASTLAAGALTLTLNGGDGADVLTGSQGDDLLNGGAQADTINIIGGAATVLGSAGDDAVNVNTDGAGSASATFDASQRVGALTVGGGGIVTLTAGGANVLTVTSLGIAATGKLDLNDNGLIVDYAGASPIAAIQSLLCRGYNGGAWNGNGIMTGRGDASRFALGFAEASDVAPGGLPGGQAVDQTAVVIKFTLYGDATLDGKVNFNDLVKLAQNFNSNVSAATQGAWGRADFTYDGMTDFNDLVKLAQNYNTSVPAVVAGQPQGAAAVVAQAAQPVAQRVTKKATPFARHRGRAGLLKARIGVTGL